MWFSFTDAKFVDYWGWTLKDFAIFTSSTWHQWQNWSKILITIPPSTGKIQFSSRWCFCPKIQHGKKNPGKNREFFHDFYLFCKNYCLDIVSLKFIFCVVFLQCCVTFMTRKQLRIIFGLNYEDLYKLLCSSKMMVIMHNRYFRE